jgi:integrase
VFLSQGRVYRWLHACSITVRLDTFARVAPINPFALLRSAQYVDDRAGRITVAELGEQWRTALLHVDTTAIRVGHALRLRGRCDLLIHAGASVKTVQLAFGHANPTITLNLYVHEWLDVLDRNRSLVDIALGTHETAATPAVSR